MPQQRDLFGREPPQLTTDFSALTRVELDDDAWYDYVPSWVSGHAALFDTLLGTLCWRQYDRVLFGQRRQEPRLHAVLGDEAPAPPLVVEMQRAIEARYGERFPRISMALYRDGTDSVAWHGDTTARDLPTAHVATVSLGGPRKLALRPKAGGRSLVVPLGNGDLFVMGGTLQRTWRHAVHKVAHAEPRIAIMFRPVWRES